MLFFCYTRIYTHIRIITVFTADDAVFSNGVMTVRINVPGFGSDLYLCYQIRGEPGMNLNFVSDECTSVNAHYGKVKIGRVNFLTIMDSINIVAIDDQGNCHYISVDANDCLVTLDGEAQEAPSKEQTIPHSVYERNGISVHYNTSRVRVSVPNCEDNVIVMWVTCHNQSFHNPFTNSKTKSIAVIKFEVTRGLNLSESSHGLLGKPKHQISVAYTCNLIIMLYTISSFRSVLEYPRGSDRV